MHANRIHGLPIICCPYPSMCRHIPYISELQLLKEKRSSLLPPFMLSCFLFQPEVKVTWVMHVLSSVDLRLPKHLLKESTSYLLPLLNKPLCFGLQVEVTWIRHRVTKESPSPTVIFVERIRITSLMIGIFVHSKTKSCTILQN